MNLAICVGDAAYSCRTVGGQSSFEQDGLGAHGRSHPVSVNLSDILLRARLQRTPFDAACVRSPPIASSFYSIATLFAQLHRILMRHQRGGCMYARGTYHGYGISGPDR